MFLYQTRRSSESLPPPPPPPPLLLLLPPLPPPPLLPSRPNRPTYVSSALTSSGQALAAARALAARMLDG